MSKQINWIQEQKPMTPRKIQKMKQLIKIFNKLFFPFLINTYNLSLIF